MAKWTYKSVRRDHEAGKYVAPDEMLAQEAANDWELITVTIATMILQTGFSEIFYFRKQAAPVFRKQAIPAESGLPPKKES